MKHKLISTLVTTIDNAAERQDIPSVEEMVNATRLNPHRWNPVIRLISGQSNDSIHEQRKVLRAFIDTFWHYTNPVGSFVNSLIILGPPGVGKTFLMMMSTIKAICMGLNVCVSALLSERAIVLGGRHLHFLFKIPVREMRSVKHLAELTVTNWWPIQLQWNSCVN